MDLEAAIAHCLSQPHVTEEPPFGPEVLVYKVGGKMFFALTPQTRNNPGRFRSTPL